MIRSYFLSALMLVFGMGLAGCTWVALTPAAEQVRVGSAATLDGCKKVGTTRARSKANIGIFDRSDKKVARELESLARNDAPGLGGNTVVADGPVTAEGTQPFSIYACPAAQRSMD